ncbi:hypothetical protein ACE1OE_10815 [Vibrio sp. E150_011]
MFDLLKKVIVINFVAALTVFLLDQYVPFFYTTKVIDFLFFVVIVIWVLAKLMWEGGRGIKTVRVDDSQTDKVYKMVKDHDFDQEFQRHERQNYQTGLVFFIAGLPAFITCIFLQFL